MSTHSDIDAAQSPSRASQTEEGVVIELAGAAQLPVRGKGRAKPVSVDRLAAMVSEVLPENFGGVSLIGFETAWEAMAAETRRALTDDLSCYITWCREEKRQALPAEPEDLVRYLRWLEQGRGYKPATLTRRIASIARIHRMLALCSRESLPTRAAMVADALKAARRRKGAQQRQAVGIRLGTAMNPQDEVRGVTLAMLFSVCGSDLQGLRDGALIAVAFETGLRVSELAAIQIHDLDPQSDGRGILAIGKTKTDQEGEGRYAWLSIDTMRRIGRWLEASQFNGGPLFRRVGVDRRQGRPARAPQEYFSIPGHTRYWRERLQGSPAEPPRTRYAIGDGPLTRQGINAIYKRLARAAIDAELVEEEPGREGDLLRTISTHSMRVGLTQDLFASGEDGAGVCQAIGWKSVSTALRYVRKQSVKGGAVSRVFDELRK
ncbi:site-specific integrase [Sphingobium fluviale]|uniref:Integrase n=1 Tax=Sphingobium fluviale TaxID=2506423 RepID=A0A4Q1KGB4_9SPHN|nr:tyrosine-type recombinase/integrase [Sphingobium fluviale]RXR25540.1 integrase [Sphingobium fluviale]